MNLSNKLFLLLSTNLLLCACAPFSPDSTHAGTCNELNSKMIFDGSGGGTSNIRQAEIQDADQPLIQRNYRAKCES